MLFESFENRRLQHLHERSRLCILAKSIRSWQVFVGALMTTFQKEGYYSLGICILDLTHKTKTRWQLPSNNQGWIPTRKRYTTNQEFGSWTEPRIWQLDRTGWWSPISFHLLYPCATTIMILLTRIYYTMCTVGSKLCKLRSISKIPLSQSFRSFSM